MGPGRGQLLTMGFVRQWRLGERARVGWLEHVTYLWFRFVMRISEGCHFVT